MAALLAQAQPGHAGAGAVVTRSVMVCEGVGAGDRVVAESLDAQQAPVGGEADLPQGGQIGQPFADPEVGGVVDGGLGP